MRILEWNSSSKAQQSAALQRPALKDAARINAAARDIIERVRREGDAALRALTQAIRRRSSRSLGSERRRI